MASVFLMPEKYGEDEFVEKKSRFIGICAPVVDEREALSVLAEVRQKNKDANHNIYAYIIKDGPVRFSDDGEPQGTGGKPALEVLEREKVTNAIVVVTRYFGGTLLGAGGLTRAYARGAKLGLDAAGIAKMEPIVRAALAYPYHLGGIIEEYLKTVALMEQKEYAEQVRTTITFHPSREAELTRALADMSAGSVRPESMGTFFMAGHPFGIGQVVAR